MKTTEFKVHAAYTKDDIVDMQKVTTKKMRTIGLSVSGILFVLYIAVVLWDSYKEKGHASLAALVSGGILDTILIASLAFAIVMMILMPYLQAKKIMKSVVGDVLKANYYFYERTFQYGWGSSFETIGYVNIQEFVNLEKAFYIKANDVSYWVKKEDFEVGNADDFYEFMKGKVRCKVK